MKQVVQHLRSGRIEVAEAPAPAPRAGHLVVQTAATLISPGTERMLVQFGRSGLLGKALLFAAYVGVYEATATLAWDPTSWVTWAAAMLLVGLYFTILYRIDGSLSSSTPAE